MQKASEIWSAVNSEAAAAAKGAWEGVKPAHKVFLSDIIASPKKNAFVRKWLGTDITYVSFIGAMHVGALLAPFYFTWQAFNCFWVMYFITGCLGITLSYHRQLSHKSFQTPKWLEYALAYCGALAVQGDPIEWASSHRYHHQHCDTPKDPHTPYEGFWWSHMGWLLDNEATIERVGDRSTLAGDGRAAVLPILGEDVHVAHRCVGVRFIPPRRFTLLSVGLLRENCLGVPHHLGGQLRRPLLGQTNVQHRRLVQKQLIGWNFSIWRRGGTTTTTRSNLAPDTGWSGGKWT